MQMFYFNDILGFNIHDSMKHLKSLEYFSSISSKLIRVTTYRPMSYLMTNELQFFRH
jgi:ribosome biogenesis protein Nip4